MRERKYIKLRVNMYEDTKFKIIDTMEERDLIHYIWTRLVTLAGKVNLEGNLYMSKNIAYTAETLAIEFNRSVQKVELALNVFKDLEMVEVTEEGVYKVKNFVKHQNIKVKEKTESADNKGQFNNKESIVNEELKNKISEENKKDIKDKKEKNSKLNYIKHNKINENIEIKNIKSKDINCENELNNKVKIIELKKDKAEGVSLNNKDMDVKENAQVDLNFNSEVLLEKKKTKKRTKNNKKQEKHKNEIIEVYDNYEDDTTEVCGFTDVFDLEGYTMVKSFSF